MKAGWLVALLLAVAVVYQGCQLREAQAAGAASALRADSILAAADSTRVLEGKVHRAVLKLYGDSMQAVERRSVQAVQRADALDRALNRERIALAQATISIETLEAIVTGLTRLDTADVRVADFVVRQEPYSIEATARLPPPPLAGSLAVGVRLDSIPLELRLGCGSTQPDGIRPASATLVGPAWATLNLGRVTQSPDLCASPALAKRGPSRLRWLGTGAGLMIVGRWVVQTFFGPN